jgi:pilus assembly protein Flp/PilA
VEQGELTMLQVRRYLRDETGVTGIEYGLIASAIAMAIVIVVANVGSSLVTVFTNVETGLNTAG